MRPATRLLSFLLLESIRGHRCRVPHGRSGSHTHLPIPCHQTRRCSRTCPMHCWKVDAAVRLARTTGKTTPKLHNLGQYVNNAAPTAALVPPLHRHGRRVPPRPARVAGRRDTRARAGPWDHPRWRSPSRRPLPRRGRALAERLFAPMGSGRVTAEGDPARPGLPRMGRVRALCHPPHAEGRAFRLADYTQPPPTSCCRSSTTPKLLLDLAEDRGRPLPARAKRRLMATHPPTSPPSSTPEAVSSTAQGHPHGRGSAPSAPAAGRVGGDDRRRWSPGRGGGPRSRSAPTGGTPWWRRSRRAGRAYRHPDLGCGSGRSSGHWRCSTEGVPQDHWGGRLRPPPSRSPPGGSSSTTCGEPDPRSAWSCFRGSITYTGLRRSAGGYDASAVLMEVVEHLDPPAAAGAGTRRLRRRQAPDGGGHHPQRRVQPALRER